MIRVRLVVRGSDFDSADASLHAHLDRAVDLRRRLFPDPAETNAYRVVHAEGDGLPGLVVDRGVPARRVLAVGAGSRVLVAVVGGSLGGDAGPQQQVPVVVERVGDGLGALARGDLDGEQAG